MRVATVVGARPQFVKAATVSRVLRESVGIEEVLIHTGQHYDENMSEIFFDELEIREPDVHLGIGGGSHGENTGRMIEAIENELKAIRPDWALVYGDTDSTLAGAIAAVKLGIPVNHVEAGLRSFNRRMPEEINRVLTDHAADLLCAPTEVAVENLRREGLTGERIHMVGDVMYDASLYYRAMLRRPGALADLEDRPFVLCTVHRAENTDDAVRLAAVVRALNDLAERVSVVLPLHPRTAGALRRRDCGALTSRVRVIAPVGYLEMHWLLHHCCLVLTDSGGLQKEAYFYRRPCVTLRCETEWVELVRAGFNQLSAPGVDDIVGACASMIQQEVPAGNAMYGDGHAAEKIVAVMLGAVRNA